MAVSGVLPVGEDEDGVRVVVLPAESIAFLRGAEVGAGLAEFAEGGRVAAGRAWPRSSRSVSWTPWTPWTATALTCGATTASASSQRDRTFPTSSRRLAPLPARGPAPGRACAPAFVPLQPGRLPCRAPSMQPPDAREGVRRGWGGRLHGFTEPLWREPRRSWPQRRALSGRSTDCPTRRKLTGP